MAETVTLLDPRALEPNRDNPRLIFHEDELRLLEDSIAKQGILVPLTVFRDGKKYFLLDGERRWRCSIRLGLTAVPVIVQPKPDRMQNLMMMFAIHNARKDWDPLPTALKLEELETEHTRRHGTPPSETELAGIASIPRGEVRRLKKLLRLPLEYRSELMQELEKPRSQQTLTVDHVIEASAGVEALSKRGLITENAADSLRRAVVDKFKSGVIVNTVAPRKLANLARAVERAQVTVAIAKRAVKKLIEDPAYSIDDAYTETIEIADMEHTIDQLAERLVGKLNEFQLRGGSLSGNVLSVLKELIRLLRRYV